MRNFAAVLRTRPDFSLFSRFRKSSWARAGGRRSLPMKYCSYVTFSDMSSSSSSSHSCCALSLVDFFDASSPPNAFTLAEDLPGEDLAADVGFPGSCGMQPQSVPKTRPRINLMQGWE